MFMVRTMLTVLTVLGTDVNYPVSSSALTTEGNVDAQYPKDRLRATQSAGEASGAVSKRHHDEANRISPT
jgi:hypothetical protein